MMTFLKRSTKKLFKHLSKEILELLRESLVLKKEKD
jgi:hypothetical protein